MDMQEINQKVEESVRVGIVEMLTSPEYGRDWIHELAENQFEKDEITNEILDLIDATFHVMATEIAHKVSQSMKDQKNIETYS